MRMGISPREAVGPLRTKKVGFTLVEVVVAMLILSTVAAGMLAVFVVGRRSIGLAGHSAQALEFAREWAERLKGNVGGHLWSPSDPDLDVGVDKSTPALTGDLANLEGVRTYTVENIDADGDLTFEPEEEYKRATVTVTWTEPD